MTPIEFLYHLNQRSPESRLNLAQMGAMFEMLAGVLAIPLRVDDKASRTARLTDRLAFAEWLGVSPSIVDAWRFSQTTGNSLIYRLGSILEWIHAHLNPLVSDSTVDLDMLDIDSDFISACWRDQIAVVVIDDRSVGFFLSFDIDADPTAYELFENRTLGLEPAQMTRDQLGQTLELMKRYGEFGTAIAKDPTKARKIYEDCKNDALPALKLQFFYTALLHNYELAEEISKGLEPDLIAKHFNTANWLFEMRVNKVFQDVVDQMRHSFELLHKRHVDLNLFTSMKKKNSSEPHVTVSHLMADCKGDTFRLKEIEECGVGYTDLMVTLLDRGLNYAISNKEGVTAIDISNDIEKKHGEGSSLFKKALEKYSLHRRLMSLPSR